MDFWVRRRPLLSTYLIIALTAKAVFVKTENGYRPNVSQAIIMDYGVSIIISPASHPRLIMRVRKLREREDGLAR